MLELKPNEQGVYEIAATEQPGTEVAEMEQVAGTLGGFAKTEVAGIPLGGAILGGTTAFIVDSLTSRFLPQVTGSMANLLGAVVLVYVGKRFLGAPTAKYGAMFLTYEAVRDYIEGALAPFLGSVAQSPASMGQQPAVSSQYYANALRR